MEKDLTRGSIGKNLIYFSLPYLLSYFLQTLYGLADLFITGQYGYTADITAVSIGSQVMHMVTVMIVGIAMGSTVIIGHAVGCKDTEQKNTAIGNTVTLFILISVILTVLLSVSVSGIVSVMSTPIEAVRGTSDYLFVCFCGIPFITAYNIIGSVFRGMGDSKTPMYFVAIACFCNILIDYVLIGHLGLGPVGAALGTTISQGISVIIALTETVKKQLIYGIKRVHFKLNKEISLGILKVGVPICAQDGFIQISFIVITIFANMRGLNDSAAVGVVEKIIGIIFLVPSTLLSSVSAICAQNIGAGLHDRARRTLMDAMVIVVGFGLVISVSMQFCAGDAVHLFTGESEVILLGAQYMKSYVWDCILAGIHFVFSGFFCAYSMSQLSFMHNVISAFLVRIPLAYYFSKAFTDTLFPMGFAAPIGSLVSIIICVFAYRWLRNKIRVEGGF